MLKQDFKSVINELKKTDINDSVAYYALVDKEVELLTSNTEETLKFINDNDDELSFVYMAETMFRIVQKEKNDVILKAFEKSTERFPEAMSKFNIRKLISYAWEKLGLENKWFSSNLLGKLLRILVVKVANILILTKRQTTCLKSKNWTEKKLYTTGWRTGSNWGWRNQGCGFYRGRLILPYEHLSRYQNDIID